MKKNVLIGLIVFWVSVLVASYLWNRSMIVSNNRKVVYSKSKAFFDQIVITRAWNSLHQGVYVPVTTMTKPNPYLHDSLRDIVTIDGMRLTKINPAYMTRQIAEINMKQDGIQFHITSLKPIRPENKADNWETKALKEFEAGSKEVLELVNQDSVSTYRYMAPLFVAKSCLACHTKQGYTMGEIRGGISVSFSAALYQKVMMDELTSFALIHFFILILGLLGLLVFYWKTNDYIIKINRKNDELVKLNATKDKFFSIIGHDLKSPFNAVIGFSELMEEELKGKDYTGVEEYAGIIKNSSLRAMSLLNNLLVWSNSQTGRMDFRPERFDLVALIDEVTLFLGDSAQQKSISLTKEIPSEVVVLADKAMIGTVLRNLISNAVKFSHKGGSIKISLDQSPSELVISVNDNGVGINKEDQEKLFRIDTNHTTLGTQKEIGTGLGLLLCKEFIEKHGGKIGVESIVGHGSRFYFTIPCKSVI